MELDAAVRTSTHSRVVRKGQRIQSLWRGYGEVVRYHLEAGQSVVVKHVRPPAGAHPRKLRSYAVEAAWYTHHAARLPSVTRVPRLFGTHSHGHHRVFVLEDLHAAGFNRSLRPLDPARIRAVLDWLAGLHATFIGPVPDNLWPVGTYWHLQTRLAELKATPERRWHTRGPELDALLRNARFQTVVHGDAKPANFLWDPRARAVAGVDFQYVGGGVGIRDVVYFLDVDADSPWLDHYFGALRSMLPHHIDADALEAEWRSLIPVAAEDFDRFMAGWGRA